MSHGHSSHNRFSAKKVVAASLEHLGFFAETISFILIISENKERFYNSFYLGSIILLILCVLLHHFFNLTNLDIIDELDEGQIKDLGFSVKWIQRSKLEDIIRIMIFLLFSVISGAITYIIIVGIEAYSITESLDLSLFTTFYVSAYLTLSFIMLLWHFLGMATDKETYLKPRKVNDQHIITFPKFLFPNSLITFFASDVLGFFVWICFFMMFVLQKWWISKWLFVVGFLYIAVIMIRFFIHIRAKLKAKPSPYFFYTVAFIVLSFVSINSIIYVYYKTIHPSRVGILDNITKNKEPLVIAMEEDSIPMYYMAADSAGRYMATGFGYEFANRLSQLMGVEFKIITARFGELPHRLYNGEADIIIAGETDEVKNCEDTEPFIDTVGLCIIVKKSDSLKYAKDYQSLLSDKKIAVFKGAETALLWAKDHFRQAEIDNSQTGSFWLNNFNKLHWDAVVYEYMYAKDEIKQLTEPDVKDQLCIVAKNLPGSIRQFRILVPEHNEELVHKLNEHIRAIKKTPFYDSIMNKYIRQ